MILPPGTASQRVVIERSRPGGGSSALPTG